MKNTYFSLNYKKYFTLVITMKNAYRCVSMGYC
jgi:hypothetical protein